MVEGVIFGIESTPSLISGIFDKLCLASCIVTLLNDVVRLVQEFEKTVANYPTLIRSTE